MNLLANLAGHVLEITLAMALIIALLLALRPLLRRRYRAKLYYWIWLAAALRLVIPLNPSLPEAAVQVPLPEMTAVYRQADQPARFPPEQVPVPVTAQPSLIQASPVQAGGTAVAAAPGAAEAPQPAAYVPSVSLAQLAILAWLAGGTAFLGWNLSSYARFRRRARRWRGAEEHPEILAQFQALRQELGVKRLGLARCSAVASPLVTGFVHPELLLPAGDFSAAELDAIFRHELIHARRHDLWYKLLLLLAQCVHWFNPLVHLMVRQAGRDLELSCDEAVVAGQDTAFKERYGRAILSAAEQGIRQAAPLTSYFYGGKQAMLERLKAILGKGGKRRGAVVLCVLAVVVAGAAAACSVGGREPGPETADLIGYTGPVRWELEDGSAVVLDNDGRGILTFYLEQHRDGETYRIPFQQLPADYGEDLPYPYADVVEARPFTGVLNHDGFVLTYGLDASSQPVEYYALTGDRDSPELLLACDGMVYELDWDNDGDAEVLECQYGVDGEARIYDWLATGGLSLEEGGPGAAAVADVNYAAARKLGFLRGAVGLEYLPTEGGYQPGDPLEFRCFPQMRDLGTLAADAVPEGTQVSLAWDDLRGFCSPVDAYIRIEENLWPDDPDGANRDEGALCLYGEDGQGYEVWYSFRLPADIMILGEDSYSGREYWRAEPVGKLELLDNFSSDGLTYLGKGVYTKSGMGFWNGSLDTEVLPEDKKHYQTWYYPISNSNGYYICFRWDEADPEGAKLARSTLAYFGNAVKFTFYAYEKPTAEMFGLTGDYATIFDYLVDQRWGGSRLIESPYLPRVICYGTYEKDGKTVYVCRVVEYYYLTPEERSVTSGWRISYAAFSIDNKDGTLTVYDDQHNPYSENWNYRLFIRDLCGPLIHVADYFLEDSDLWVEPVWDGMPAEPDMLRTYVQVTGAPIETVDAVPLEDYTGS